MGDTYDQIRRPAARGRPADRILMVEPDSAEPIWKTRVERCFQSGLDPTNRTSGNDRRGMSSGFPKMSFRRPGMLT